MKRFFFAAMAAAAMVGCVSKSEPVVTFVEADDPVAISAEAEAKWGEVKKALNGAWGCADVHYSRSEVPAVGEVKTMPIVAWKGERANAQLVLWTAEGASGVKCEVKDFTSAAATLPASIAKAHFVRYTLADKSCEDHNGTVLKPDMLDSLDRFDMAAKTVRPVWLSIEVPADAAEGIYNSEVVVSYDGMGKIKLPLTLEVQKHTLATPDKWSYHLDLWQHPTAVARAYGLELWSDAHFEALKPIMTRLANAGQKVITTTLNKDPWNHQCYDAYEDMIKWTLKKDGTWSYDYAIFDRVVETMMGVGINKMINCYSMVPWNCELHYFDEAKGEQVTVKAEPGTPIFPKIWKPFLTDFKKHLEAKGWLNITNIAMDERGPEAMEATIKVLTECAPEMGFALADMHKSYRLFKDNMRDVCVLMTQRADHEDIVARRERGFNTTFYVCCGPGYPNTFTNSNPYEAELLGLFNVACDYDGMLRWAYNSWPENPAMDSRFGGWTSGDTYLVYPHNRSSIRFERLIDGIEDAEKVRQLRREGVDTKEIDAVLEKISTGDVNNSKGPWKEVTAEAREAINSASRK
ncbi:MAG: DUF4091 domain-containing protein [Alistipes sp.]|nr:DUF4091 domain-containing protein [Alistipes sp.]